MIAINQKDLEVYRKMIFSGLGDVVPIHLQWALITEHKEARALQRAEISARGASSMHEIQQLGAELRGEETDYASLEKVASERLTRILDGAPQAFCTDDGHVGTIFDAACTGATELPKGIAAQ